jgi:hypothetical protein
MTEDGRLARFLRTKLRGAGRQVEEARRAYGQARDGARADLPLDGDGKARIVCRRHAERRTVAVEAGKPACYEADHPDCEGCVEDIADGRIETW